MAKRSDVRPAIDRINALAEARKVAIEAEAGAILEEMHLADIRKVLRVTQMEAPDKVSLPQSEISRVERASASAQLRTLDRYARSLGGRMKLVMEFPDGTMAELALRNGRPRVERYSGIEAQAPSNRCQCCSKDRDRRLPALRAA